MAVEGIFSGTLSYLFNEYKPGMAFSDVITDAKNKGFTEPDPRDDLSGTDVARKVTILARACGIEVELEKVPVTSLVPGARQTPTPERSTTAADGPARPRCGVLTRAPSRPSCPCVFAGAAALQDWQPEKGAKLADAFIEEMKAFDDEKAAQISVRRSHPHRNLF